MQINFKVYEASELSLFRSNKCVYC